ncbi:hypothetical protein GDO86_010303, partial [Hymenochirus boettgeri]
VCFVNLSVIKEDKSHGILRKKLLDVSPDVPKLLASMKEQELKENEILMLSGLTSGRPRPMIEGQQVSCPTEICILQYTSPLRQTGPSCILLELNKFLLGIELAKENVLDRDHSPPQAEDDTNCSVSSIEEDFLTASEQLEEESEGESLKRDPSHDTENQRHQVTQNLQNMNWRGVHSNIESCSSQAEPANGLEYLNEMHMDTRRSWSSHEDFPEGAQRQHVRRLSSLVGSDEESTDFMPLKQSCVLELFKEYTCQDQTPEGTNYTKECAADYFGEPATTGQYATNLAECVLQDAFIRLSQSQTSYTEEAAVCISAGNTLLSENSTKEDAPLASRTWNELPKIVIVQSPDCCDSPTEWADESHWSEQESPVTVHEIWKNENVSVDPSKNTLEVALACAASIIGTITSPHTTEKIKKEQREPPDLERSTNDQHNKAKLPDVLGDEFSVPSALCGMTQVASAVAFCGLGDQKRDSYPATASGLLAAADASTAVTLHCSITLGSSLEKLKDNIASVLLKEASMVLTSPCKYKNLGEFIECMNERILSSANSTKLTHVEDIANDDLAHNLSDAILRHSAERLQSEVTHTLQSDDTANLRMHGSFVAIATDLLFSVMHFTCKKMGDLVQSGDMPYELKDDNNSTSNSANEESQNDDVTDDSTLSERSEDPWHGTTLTQLCKGNSDLKHEHKPSQYPDIAQPDVHSTELNCCEQTQQNIKAASKPYIKREIYRHHHNDHRALLGRESTITIEEFKNFNQDQGSTEGTMYFGNQEKPSYEPNLSKDFPSSSIPISTYMLHPSHAIISVKHTTSNYSLTDFADDLAETVVSMATEIAAICLENSHGKQPWFCAWAKGSECLVTPCRTAKRKKDTSSGGSVIRRHRPPRLSEIKKKTDEHPELKERLMNRVVDESINLEDPPDTVISFANEVASKIMHLTESSAADSLWQGGQNLARNRLHCDRWNRGKASSYESIPEEDSDAKILSNTLDPSSILGQPFSRTGSVSKQSSCESITDEFSRFMVNQMENEGREFELLLDYYAGKNANNILNSALQQISKRNNHLNVTTSCLSKQSSTESITEEFYRYMLKEIDKENKDAISNRNTAAWANSLRPPSPRMPFCFRQSSMPCNRTSSARLTVNTPVKANSLDGFARRGSQDFINLHPVNSMSSINLCKSDSCLYQRGQTDEATSMLIHETWSSSIEELMRKNKIIVNPTEDTEADLSPKGSPAHVNSYANKLAADIVQSGKSVLGLHQHSLDDTNRGGFNHRNTGQGQSKDTAHQHGLSFSPREVPLIQIEAEQKEETEEEDKENILALTLSEDFKSSRQDGERNILLAGVRDLKRRTTHGIEVLQKRKTNPDPPTSINSSEDSTGSWSQLANEENPEDTSSFLHHSEQSISSNSNTTSSVGPMDLDSYLETISPTATNTIKEEEKQITKDTQEKADECTSGLSVGTASYQQEVSVLNIDLETDCTESELRTTLQWIAASELGIPVVYFRKTQEQNMQKFLEVTHLVQAKSWKVGDLYSALILHCKMQTQGGKVTPSFFDWLLELG